MKELTIDSSELCNIWQSLDLKYKFLQFRIITSKNEVEQTLNF